ncbi:MAG: M23 family metallopeptidase [candidate division NC10 bacterium]|nr:M23 family metallopeptidase [candidate division NC10 bacterium]
MAKRFYTILILPDATAKALKLHVPKSIFAVLAGVLGFILVWLFFSIYQHIALQSQILELKRLRREVGEHHSVQERFRKLERALLSLKDLDHKLRKVAGLKPEGSPLAVGGSKEGGNGVRLDMVAATDRDLIDGMKRDLEKLQQEITLREQSLKELKKFFEEKQSLLTSTPIIWPVKGWLTSGFGDRISPFSGRREMHEGLDIAVPTGTPVLAPAAGVVAFAGFLSGHGNAVLIEHGHGFSSFYGHNSRVMVKAGYRVKRGQVIVYSGDTGLSTGPHLHYGVRLNGQWVDPRSYIVEGDLPTLGEGPMGDALSESPERVLSKEQL